MGDAERGLYTTGLITNIFDTGTQLMTDSMLNRFVDLFGNGGIVMAKLSDTTLKIVDAGSGKINVKAGVAWDKFGQRIILAADDTSQGEFTGSVDLSSNIDLSTNYNIKLDIDNAGAVEIDCRNGAVSNSAVTITEIVRNINAAGFGRVAFETGSDGNPSGTNYITIKSLSTGASSEVEFVSPAATDATNEIFGLNEASYPHTYNGGGGYTIPDSSGATSYNILLEYAYTDDTPGTFLAGYPDAADNAFTQRHDSYNITITTASPVSTSTQHQIKLGDAANDGGTIAINDNRENIMIQMLGELAPAGDKPPTPKIDTLTTGLAKSIGKATVVDDFPTPLGTGFITVDWTGDDDATSYTIQFVPLDQDASDDELPNHLEEMTITAKDATGKVKTIATKHGLPLNTKWRIRLRTNFSGRLRAVRIGDDNSLWSDKGDIVITDGFNQTMGTVTATAQIYGVLLTMQAVTDARFFQVVWTTDGATAPDFANATHQKALSLGLTARIEAPAGTKVKYKVRGVSVGGFFTTDTVTGETTAGGSQTKIDENNFTGIKADVLASDTTESQREIFRLRVRRPIKITEVDFNVKTTDSTGGDMGKIRLHLEGTPTDDWSKDISGIGAISEEDVDFDVISSGWLIITAWDRAEGSGNNNQIKGDITIWYHETGEFKVVKS